MQGGVHCVPMKLKKHACQGLSEIVDTKDTNFYHLEQIFFRSYRNLPVHMDRRIEQY